LWTADRDSTSGSFSSTGAGESEALQQDLDAMIIKCTQLEKEYTGIHEQVLILNSKP